MRHLFLLYILCTYFVSLAQDKDKFPASDIVITQKDGSIHHLLYMDGFFLNYQKGGSEVYVVEAGSNARLDYDLSLLDNVSFTYEEKKYRLKPYKTPKAKRKILLDSVIVTEHVTLLRTPGNDYVTQYFYLDAEGVVHAIDKTLDQMLVFLNCPVLNEKYNNVKNKFLTRKEIIELVEEYESSCQS